MASSTFRLVGVELYFADLPRARAFYQEVLGLELAETHEGHHVKFATPGGFICLERQGVEEYPSADSRKPFPYTRACARGMVLLGGFGVG